MHCNVLFCFELCCAVSYCILLYGYFRKRARWTKSRAVIGYPSGQDGAILPARDYPLYPASKISPKAHIINPLLTKFVRSRWLDIGLVLFWRVYGPRLRLGPKTRKKKNLANIQPSSPHTWSITHTYCTVWHIVRANLRAPQFLKVERYAQRLSHRVCMGHGSSGWWAPVNFSYLNLTINSILIKKKRRKTIR